MKIHIVLIMVLTLSTCLLAVVQPIPPCCTGQGLGYISAAIEDTDLPEICDILTFLVAANKSARSTTPLCTDTTSQCKICQRPNDVSIYYDATPARDIDEYYRISIDNFGDFGAILQDSADNSIGSPCPTLAEDCLESKLLSAFEYQCQPDHEDPFKGRLSGAYMGVILPAAQALGGRGLITPQLDYIVRSAAQRYYFNMDECYIFPHEDWSCCSFSDGNTCMDEYVAGALGYAWIMAWESKSGRIFGNQSLFCNSIDDVIQNVNDLFRTTDPYGSICLRDKKDSMTTTICDASMNTANGLLQHLNADIDVMAFDHRTTNYNPELGLDTFENPNYGLGLFSSLSAAILGLKEAGIEIAFALGSSSSSGNTPYSDRFKILLAQQLFEEGQKNVQGAGANDAEFQDSCYWWRSTITNNCETGPTEDCNCNSICDSSDGMFTCIDCYHNAPCWDPSQCDWDLLDENCPSQVYRPGCDGYYFHPGMYPLRKFMKEYFYLSERNAEFGLPALIDNGKYQFSDFNDDFFCTAQAAFHDGRSSVYRDLAWCWWNPDSIDDPQGTCAAHPKPTLVGPPAMWTDVPPATATGLSTQVCQDSEFEGWVFTDDEAGGTNSGSGRALVVDAAESCLTVDYPASGYTPLSLYRERGDVCNAYRNAFSDPNFFQDPNCLFAGGTDRLGWRFSYSKGGVGNYKLLVWFSDSLGNLKCSERLFDVVDSCTSVSPTPFINISPLNGKMLYDSSVTLKWLPSVNASSYEVYFGLTASPPLVQTGVTGTEYTVTVSGGNQYFWKIRAIGQGGVMDGEVWQFNTGATCTAPIAPTLLNLAVDPEPCAGTGIKVTWPIAAGDWKDSCHTQCDMRRYQVLRNGIVVHSEYGPWGSVGFTEGTPIPDRMWMDTNVTPNISYTYKVRYINQCNLTGDTNSVTVVDHAYAPIVPEILSSGPNTCPAQTVRLTASSGSGQYQWYLDKTAISNATQSYYDASQSGLYSVGCKDAHYCDVHSAEQYIEVQACPNIQLISAQAPTRVTGDDDTVIEAGERWRVEVTLTNTGTAAAKNVQLSLAGPGMLIFYNPALINDFPREASRTAYFEFISDPAEYYTPRVCATPVTLTLSEISSDGGSILYDAGQSIATFSVGNAGEQQSATAASFNAPKSITGSTSLFTVNSQFYPKASTIEATVALSVPDPAIATTCLALSFKDLSGTLRPIKAFGDPYQEVYNVLPWYTGPANRDARYGLYGVVKSHTACPSYIQLSNLAMAVAKTAPNCGIYRDAVLKLDQVSTAGGTIVSLSGAPGRFTGVTGVNVGIAGVEGECSALRAATDISVNLEGTLLTFITPAAAQDSTFEGAEGARLADVQLVSDTGSTCLPGVLKLVPLAFTSNQLTGDISVIDTISQERFAPMQSMPLLDGTLPFGIALGRGAKAGRELYVVDYATGNLQIYDAVNFQYLSTVILQDPNSYYVGNGAIDLAVSADGTRAYVIHLTDGLPYLSTGNPGYGGISVVDLENRVLLDANPSPDTWSSGAPMGYNRITTDLYPYSISNLLLERNVDNYMVDDGWPGEYAFVSGVGPAPYLPGRWRCACVKARPPYRPCLYPCDKTCKSEMGELRLCWIENYGSRPLKVGVLNLNSQYVSALVPLTPSDYVQEDPNDQVYEAYLGSQWIGTDGRILGNSNQGIDFSLLSAGREHPEDARILAVSPEEDRVYAFDFTEATRNPLAFAFTALPLSCVDAAGDPITCRPLDIKVQSISLAGTPTPLAFTANADASSLSILDPTAISLYGNPIPENMCHAHQYPVSLDIRSDGSWGYVANYSSDTLLALNFKQYLNGDTSCSSYASIPVGMMPVRVVVQEVPSFEGFAAKVSTTLNYAPASSFDQPAQQETLIRSWESIRELQETNASPQAILAHLDNFQRNATQWITSITVSATVNEGVDLYRAAYLQENDLPGNL